MVHTTQKKAAATTSAVAAAPLKTGGRGKGRQASDILSNAAIRKLSQKGSIRNTQVQQYLNMMLPGRTPTDAKDAKHARKDYLRLQADVYTSVRDLARKFIRQLIEKAALYTTYKRSATLQIDALMRAGEHCGFRIYGVTD
jgi:histone H3/H4